MHESMFFGVDRFCTCVCVLMLMLRWSLMEEERRVNRLLKDDPENEKLNDRLQQVR